MAAQRGPSKKLEFSFTSTFTTLLTHAHKYSVTPRWFTVFISAMLWYGF